MAREIVVYYFRMQKRMWKSEPFPGRKIAVSQIAMLHKCTQKYDQRRILDTKWALFLTVCFNSS
jgi:hypothetical protein